MLAAPAKGNWSSPSSSPREGSVRRQPLSPDRDARMLQQAQAIERCSLKPGGDRACLPVHLWIDAAGRKRRHRFERGIMRSAARLTYEEIQAARDGRAGCALGPESIAALYGAYAALAEARAARGALELDLNEDRVVLDAEKRPSAIVRALRLDSHRLIREFIILANVAAAEELEARRQACMYRVHDAPDPDKVESLRVFLEETGLPGLALAKGQAIKPELFNRVLRRAAGTGEAVLVNDLVLRCQAQAAYSPNNIGHFGLALRPYAHFTSPIRRCPATVRPARSAPGAGRAPLRAGSPGGGGGCGGAPPRPTRWAAAGSSASKKSFRPAAPRRPADPGAPGRRPVPAGVADIQKT